MAYNENLAVRIRKILSPYKKKVVEKKMMGGLTFMLHNKMCCGIVKDDLMVRVIESKYRSSLNKPHCRVMDFTGKPLKGFLFVDKKGFATDKELKNWIGLGIEFVNASVKNKK